ncbi:hypothetical protein [Brevundimonas sp. Root1279]|uniref:hypothetical protein n=1 Tax=Brevundimonas sp. Root1279 TaxID=1736443 RepID=UPI000A764795|nr:hypothetical protein [Brevundimonas sp. Root1279]
MNLRKTHLWISLIVGAVVWGAYFTHFIGMTWRGETGGLALWFLGALALIVVVEGVATGLIAWLFRRRSRVLDEGPTLNAALQASHVALMILIALALGTAAVLAVCALLGWSFDLAAPRSQVIAANVLLAMVVIAELSRAALTLALMPRR